MKKICVVLASRANYGRVKYLMKAIQNHKNLELQIILGASALLSKFGDLRKTLEHDGFKISKKIFYAVSGETLVTQAKSTGLGIIELASAFEELKPNAVITVADRFETMATAIASTYLNIKLIHLQGGEVSGNIDDRVRHSITKLSDLHFVCSEQSKTRVINMGEDPERVFNYGCPSMDTLLNEDLSINENLVSNINGVGQKTNFEKPYFLMLQHPVTTSYKEGFFQVEETLNALLTFKDFQKIIMWPNIDAGSEDVSKAIRQFREQKADKTFFFVKNLTPEDYARILNNSNCCVGNSSSFIRECSFLGVPSIILGDRQIGREHGSNITKANYERNEIINILNKYRKKHRFKPEFIFGRGNAGIKIADEINNQFNLKKF